MYEWVVLARVEVDIVYKKGSQGSRERLIEKEGYLPNDWDTIVKRIEYVYLLLTEQFFE